MKPFLLTLGVLIPATILQCFWPQSVTAPEVLRVDETTLPFNSRWNTVKLYNGSLYITGNENPNTYPCSTRYGVYTYKVNPDTGAIQSSWLLPYNVSHHDSEMIDGKVVTVGGLVGNSSNVCFSAIWAETQNPAAYSTVFSTGVHDTETILLNDGTILSVGGWEGNVTSPQIKRINSSLGVLNSWTLNTSRSYRTMHQLDDGTVMIIGGLNYNGSTVNNLASIEVLNPSTGTISTASYTLITGRRYHSSVYVDGKIYVIGGTSLATLGKGAGIASVERIDHAAGTVVNFATLQYPRQHQQTFLLTRNGTKYIAVFGGEHNNAPVTQAELINLDTGAVTTLNGVSWGLTDHDRISVCEGNELYLVGGSAISAGPGTSGNGTNKIVKYTFDANTTCVKQ